MYLIKNKNVELLQDRYYLSKNEYLFNMKYVRIKNIKDLCSIFNNLINEFRKIHKEKHEASELIKKEKNEALELIKKVECLIGFNLTCINKNKEFLKSKDLLYELKSKDLIYDLVALSNYSIDLNKLTIYNKTNYYIRILENFNPTYFNAYDSMNKKFKQQNFEGVKQEYTKLINNLRDYEKRHNIKLF